MNVRRRRALALVLAVTLAATHSAADDSLPGLIPLTERETPNRLTSEERAAGYILLFDGESGRSWQTGESDSFPESGWSITSEALVIEAAGRLEFRAGGDLFSRERFADFIFDFEFELSEGANSGVKYGARRQRNWGFVHSLGCEFQLLDDARHPDAHAGREGNRRLGSLYDLIPANSSPSRGIGRWNHGRIHRENGKIAHYLNGVRVLEISRPSSRWAAALAASKFADREDFCAEGPGQIALQDHGDAVRFRNLRVLPLDANPNDS